MSIKLNKDLLAGIVSLAIEKNQNNSRRINAIKKAYNYLKGEEFAMRKVEGRLIMSSPQSGEVYSVKANDCQCEAFLKGGNPCFHRETFQLVETHDKIKVMLA